MYDKKYKVVIIDDVGKNIFEKLPEELEILIVTDFFPDEEDDEHMPVADNLPITLKHIYVNNIYKPEFDKDYRKNANKVFQKIPFGCQIHFNRSKDKMKYYEEIQCCDKHTRKQNMFNIYDKESPVKMTNIIDIDNYKDDEIITINDNKVVVFNHILYQFKLYHN